VVTECRPLLYNRSTHPLTVIVPLGELKMKKPLLFLSRLALLFGSAVALFAQTDHTNAFTGTWKLNVAKSQFNPGPAPQSITATLAPDGTFTLEFVDDKGKSHKSSHPWSGGKEIPLTNDMGMENLTITSKIQGHTWDDTWKVKGRIVETVHIVLAPDGKTYTATVNTTDEQGRPVHNVMLCEKQ
jgi:hypothetical protein